MAPMVVRMLLDVQLPRSGGAHVRRCRCLTSAGAERSFRGIGPRPRVLCSVWRGGKRRVRRGAPGGGRPGRGASAPRLGARSVQGIGPQGCGWRCGLGQVLSAEERAARRPLTCFSGRPPPLSGARLTDGRSFILSVIHSVGLPLGLQGADSSSYWC